MSCAPLISRGALGGALRSNSSFLIHCWQANAHDLSRPARDLLKQHTRGQAELRRAHFLSMGSQGSPPFIVAFYDPDIQAEDGEDRTHEEMLSFSDDQLEYYHDYIQYLFPLPERSPINPHAPTITKEVREAFLSRQDLQKELRRSLERMLKFYGFTTASDGSIGEHQNFKASSSATWRKRMDHNHLRISRIIRCLRVLGLDAEAKAFHQALVKSDKTGKVSDRSLMFWQRAAQRKLHLAPQDDDGANGVEWLKDARNDAE